MTSIARHYTARFVHPSSLPHRPASTIHAYSNQNQITVQFFRSPRSKAGYGFLLSAGSESPSRSRAIFWDAVSASAPIRKEHPIIWLKTGMHFPDEPKRGRIDRATSPRYPRYLLERATLAASMPPRMARPRARRSQTNFKRTRVGHAAFLATYRPVLAGRSLGGHQLSRAAQAVSAARDACDRRFWLHRDLPRHAPAPPRRH